MPPGQSQDLPLYATPEHCAGRIFIVTGANTGLGFEATKHLVRAGAAKVILAVRNVDSGEQAKKKIEEELGVTGVAEVWQIDLASYASVKAFAARATAELDRIDAVIENAGVYDWKRILAEGHLALVTVNIISTFLLAVLLLPKLTKIATELGITPHIAIVASSVGFQSQQEWDSVKDDPLVKMDAEQERVPRLYALTKVVEILVVRQLAPRIPVSRTGVVLNVLNPGLCDTELARSAPPPVLESLRERVNQYGRTAEVGSRTLLHGAVAGPESHGHLLMSCKIDE
ncbi:putative short chain dehydrogenase/ reductase [Thozetella sp. PMI_491]|nr:putative short chain dehydrogenase/ reductase [Thozetella sp. PMI_491]